MQWKNNKKWIKDHPVSEEKKKKKSKDKWLRMFWKNQQKKAKKVIPESPAKCFTTIKHKERKNKSTLEKQGKNLEEKRRKKRKLQWKK